MNIFPKHSVTLVELLIAVSLIGLLVIGITSLDTYARLNLLTSDRRMQVQNDAAFVLEHMAKQINRGIGDADNLAVDLSDISTDPAIQIYIDGDGDGRRDTPPDDHYIAYRHRSSGQDQYQLWYCSECNNLPCTQCNTNWEVMTSKITDFIIFYDDQDVLSDGDPIDNYVEIQTLRSCWDPEQTHHNCGTLDNPQVTMRTQIKMPAVSVN